MEVFAGLGRRVTGRRSAGLVVLLAVVLSGLVIAFAGEPEDTDAQTSILPGAAESTRAAALLRTLPGGDARQALVVYTRDDEERLSRPDLAAVRADRRDLGAVAGSPVPPVRVSEDGRAALLVVTLPPTDDVGSTVDLVDALRAASRDGLPDGLSARLTGNAGFRADIGKSFAGANTRLLTVTVAVVVLLLLLTYRSPVLWLVPLAVVALADRTAGGVVDFVSRQTEVVLDGSTTGIIDVLVFGAGTNYALLIIARYREELRRTDDVHAAMRTTLRSAGPAVLGSAGTVALSLLALAFATLPNDRATGVFGSVAIAIACAFALVVLPAALVLCGRRLFWPFVPRVGDPDRTGSGGWWKVAALVARRPVPVVAASVVALLALATGVLGIDLGISQTDRFRVQAESVDGQRALERHFPAGASEPVVVVAPAASVDRVVEVARGVDGVVAVRAGASDGERTRVDVTVADAPSTAGAAATVRDLRAALDEVDEAALVGGGTAVDVDWRDYAVRDLVVVVPLVLVVVTAVLLVLLRSAVAPPVLVGTVVLTFFAALGAGVLLFEHVFGFAGVAVNVPLISFLFLVALGVDYNIFLTTRAREETARLGSRDGIVRAVAVTGGVITSAGTLLAAVFVALAVLPVIMLTEIGIVVGLGVLLDTLLVRTVVVPALVVLLGDRFWWPRLPGDPARTPSATEREPVLDRG